jgi:hypothetical protein
VNSGTEDGTLTATRTGDECFDEVQIEVSIGEACVKEFIFDDQVGTNFGGAWVSQCGNVGTSRTVTFGTGENAEIVSGDSYVVTKGPKITVPKGMLGATVYIDVEFVGLGTSSYSSRGTFFSILNNSHNTSNGCTDTGSIDFWLGTSYSSGSRSYTEGCLSSSNNCFNFNWNTSSDTGTGLTITTPDATNQPDRKLIHIVYNDTAGSSYPLNKKPDYGTGSGVDDYAQIALRFNSVDAVVRGIAIIIPDDADTPDVDESVTYIWGTNPIPVAP